MLQYKNKTLSLVAFSVFSYAFSQEKIDSTKSKKIEEVILVGKNPISEKFSVVKVEKLDIYFNPMSNADALKAITILPSSTSVDESANPTLRGGSADRTRVFINGAPVLNPVRNPQTNGLGNFSILNTEIIDKQYVYASNPPLTYSNSSAGIVEIETNKTLNFQNIQISAALTNLGLMINKSLGKKTFIQAYGNYQFSDALLSLNKKSLPNLIDFNTHDFGINLRSNISDNFSINSFNYFIDESYRGINKMYNYSDISEGGQKRFFTINNADYIKGRSKFRISTLFDTSTKEYTFGVRNSETKNHQIFVSLSHKYRLSKNLTLQYGYDFFNTNYSYNEVKPVYYFALQENAPYYNSNVKNNLNYSEIYGYADYKVSKKIGISAAIRKNIFPQNQIKSFLSSQFSSYYHLNSKNRFILGLGEYYSYSTPNYYSHSIGLLKSKQIALDYYYDSKKINITGALYYKKDFGDFNSEYYDAYNLIETFGSEISVNYNINKHFVLGLSNTFMDQHAFYGDEKFNTNNNLKYFIKAQFTYNNPKYFTASISFTKRPGNFITTVNSATYLPDSGTYQPTFNELNSYSLNNYTKLDFTINKVFKVGKSNSLVTFISINNIFNNLNQANIYYNNDYSNIGFNYFQQRIFYFGLQYRLYNTFD